MLFEILLNFIEKIILKLKNKYVIIKTIKERIYTRNNMNNIYNLYDDYSKNISSCNKIKYETIKIDDLKMNDLKIKIDDLCKLKEIGSIFKFKEKGESEFNKIMVDLKEVLLISEFIIPPEFLEAVMSDFNVRGIYSEHKCIKCGSKITRFMNHPLKEYMMGKTIFCFKCHTIWCNLSFDNSNPEESVEHFKDLWKEQIKIYLKNFGFEPEYKTEEALEALEEF